MLRTRYILFYLFILWILSHPIFLMEPPPVNLTHDLVFSGPSALTTHQAVATYTSLPAEHLSWVNLRSIWGHSLLKGLQGATTAQVQAMLDTPPELSFRYHISTQLSSRIFVYDEWEQHRLMTIELTKLVFSKTQYLKALDKNWQLSIDLIRQQLANFPPGTLPWKELVAKVLRQALGLQ